MEVSEQSPLSLVAWIRHIENKNGELTKQSVAPSLSSPGSGLTVPDACVVGVNPQEQLDHAWN